MHDELNHVIDAAIKSKTISCIGIEVIKNNNKILSLYKGTNFFIEDKDSIKAKHSEISSDYFFDIASLTKVISGFSIAAALINKNIISLDTEIGEIFSDNAIFIKKTLAKIKIKNLLNHSSGLINWLPLFKFCTCKSSAYSYIRNLNLEYDTGSKHLYSDIGYILLGEILELYYGSRLYDIFETTVVKNFNLKDIGYVLIDGVCPRNTDLFISSGYSNQRDKHLIAEVNDENASMMNGEALHAGLFSKAIEVENYGVMILNILKNRMANPFIKKEGLENLIQKTDASSWVMSWHYPDKDSSSVSYFSKNSIGMTGFTGTSLWIDIDNDTVVTILANRTISKVSAKFGGEKDSFSILRPTLHDIIMRNLC